MMVDKNQAEVCATFSRSKELGEKASNEVMTVKEVAEILNVSEQTIRHHIRNEYPNLMVNGKPTVLDQEQITAIKRLIGTGRNELANINAVQLIKTDFEMQEMVLDSMLWLKSKVDLQRNQIAVLQPKAEAYECLMKTESDMSITNAAKHFGLHPKKEVFPYLREIGYLTEKDLPTQRAIDLDILSVRQNGPDQRGKTHLQAVVKANQLNRFRKLVAEKLQRGMPA
jgi:phage antirepressor YoqD-like protein